MDITGSTLQALVCGDSTPGHVRSSPGGVARNVAENLARLGVATRLLALVGSDLNGRSLLEHTRLAGVDVSLCAMLPDAGTSTYLCLHGPDGEIVAAVNDMAILERVTPAWLTMADAPVREAAALCLDCNLSEAALAWIFSRAGAAPVFVDAVSTYKCRRVLPHLRQIHTLKANRVEVAALCGCTVQDDAAIVAAAAWLHAHGVQQVVLSMGERGVYWSSTRGHHGWQAAVPVQVTSATGAGDALMAGLVFQYLGGMPLAQAARFAVGCAALTLTAPQANHPELSQAAVLRLLQAVDGTLPRPTNQEYS